MNGKQNRAKYYLLPALVCLLSLAGIVYYYFFFAFSTLSEKTYVYIDDDDNMDSVIYKLENIAGSCQMTGFRTLARHYGYQDHIKTGRYPIEPQTSTVNVFIAIKNGRQEPLMVVIPETRTIEQLAERIANKLMIDSTEMVSALSDKAFCEQFGFNTNTIISVFVPNTYEFYWDTSVNSFMKRIKKEYDTFWNKERKDKAQSLGLTPIEVSTLASIIDEETANTKEKPIIAGMYINRLKAGMPLQADPTIKFALKDFSLKRIYHNHLLIDSPYNTYQNTGLPPGPIKVASIKGIDAVLNRTQHTYFYMCANADFSGTHVFSSNYNEHLHNAALYAKALNEKGIK